MLFDEKKAKIDYSVWGTPYAFLKKKKKNKKIF